VIHTIIPILAAVVLSASTGRAQEPEPALPSGAPSREALNPVPPTAASAAEGRRLYLEANCDGCHGATGAGDGVAASALKQPPQDLTDPDWQLGRTDGELRHVIAEGKPGTAMIASDAMFDHPDDIWHVVNYIRSLIHTHRSNP